MSNTIGAYQRAGYSIAGSGSASATLLARTDGVTTRKVTIQASRVLPAGALLGKVTVSQKHVLSVANANDGSQVPDMVLGQAADASGGDVEALAYETATVIGSALTLGAGHTLDSVRQALRGKRITIAD